jgi:hypothetical protein
MKNFLSSLFLVFAFTQLLFSQSVERYVISSFGGSYFGGSTINVDFTAGESAITTLSNGSHILTQGFQQPFIFSVVNVAENSADPIHIIIYPNPVYDHVNIDLKNGAHAQYTVQVFDILGQLIMSEQADAGFDGTFRARFDLRKLATGNYFVRVLQGEMNLLTQKILKVTQ